MGDRVIYSGRPAMVTGGPHNGKYPVQYTTGDKAVVCAPTDNSGFCVPPEKLTKPAPVEPQKFFTEKEDDVMYKGQRAKVVGESISTLRSPLYTIDIYFSEAEYKDVPQAELTAAGPRPATDVVALRASLLEEHNKARQNPPEFAKLVKQKWDAVRPIPGSITDEAYKTAVKDLSDGGKYSKKLEAPLRVSQALTDQAQKHAIAYEAARKANKDIGHAGMADRVKDAGFTGGAENIIYGYGSSALEVVRGFIVDDGENNARKGYGHRKNIFMADMTDVGFGVSPGGVVVVLFGKK